jgi:hypothetical protein
VEERRATEPKSFGVFLGSFASPPTADQQDIFSQWDIIVVDPLQAGVVEGLACCQPKSSHVLARLDTAILAESGASLNDDSVISNLGAIFEVINKRLSSADGQCHFTGILLTSFAKYFQPAVVNELARLVSDIGLDVWLELPYPEYLPVEMARSIDMNLVHGLVYRNAMVRPDGDWQNYFQMTAMRTVMRAVACQRVAHNIPLVMWETIDDDAELQYAAVARAHKLATFFNALCWIGHARAETDAEAAKTHTIHSKPLGALMWLKNESNMKAHNMWRANNEVGMHLALYWLLD